MTDTYQLPEPDLGYIKTDKSNQPAFSARQMREMKDTNQLPPLPTPKFTETIRGVPCITVTEHEHLMRAYALQARAALSLRPQAVPMTPASRNVIMATRTANADADADEWPVVRAYQRGWNNAEAHHGITAQGANTTKKELT